MAKFHGKSLVAGQRGLGSESTFRAISPLDLKELDGEFSVAAPAEIEAAAIAAQKAFRAFRDSPGESRAAFLEEIARGIEGLGNALLDRAHLETGLSKTRLASERGRTTGHLRMFAEIARSGSWLDARIQAAQPDRKPQPGPDLRRCNQPIGPVVVFGASNFPLAYSVAGGDTAAAFATGNPVIVKAHEAHPGTSELVGEVILAAAAATGLPPGVFSMLQGSGRQLGVPLVTRPEVKAVGFTGSTMAGRILMDAAAARPDPIPVFAEMGSLNPIVLLPSAWQGDVEEIADKIFRSVTTDAGQFCTKPGILILPRCPGAGRFRDALATKFRELQPMPLLHPGIAGRFPESSASVLRKTSLLGAAVGAPGEAEGSPTLLETNTRDFLAEESLRHEYFGPLAIVVMTESVDEIFPILRSLGGQLTASVFAGAEEIASLDLLPRLAEIAGRVIVNGVPTGVEVSAAMQHGGPWPACSDSRFTAVGPSALLRFTRPVSYQNVPDSLLPAALREENPLKIVRLVETILP